MCGIAGLVGTRGQPIEPWGLLLMAETIRHRGPDDEGFLLGSSTSKGCELLGGLDTPAGAFARPSAYAPQGLLTTERELDGTFDIGLASRRLAIIDASAAGHQPMCNASGDLWIVYNGELYNFLEIKAELTGLGHAFSSHTDTEVVLHAYQEWGPGCLRRFNGMWALAIWDLSRGELFLARDRLGIKPLYYHQTANRLAFASEIKALLALGLPRRVRPQAVYDFLVAGYSDHTPETFFDGINRLPAAHFMTVDPETGRSTLERYWELDLASELQLPGDAACAEALRNLLEDAVRLHLISDVPVGTCLSGGIDSSSIVCLISRLLREQGLHVVGMETRQKSFSARYHDSVHDEGTFIGAVVDACGLEAHMTYPEPAVIRDDWPNLFYHLEEPFGSSSIVAQWEVFKLARQAGVTVTLDGQGGDEILAGYLGFFPYYFADLATGLRWPQLVSGFRRHCALHGMAAQAEARNFLSNVLPVAWKTLLKTRAVRSETWLSAPFRESVCQETLEKHGPEVAGQSRLERALVASLTLDPLPSLLRFDDRNSMAHSIESRVPFLDYRLVEFCFNLPLDQKIRDGVTKYALRAAMQGIIPEAIRERHDKIGFSTPQSAWLRGQLSPWLREVFNSSEFRSRPYFEADQVLLMLEKHASGAADHSGVLWRCLAVELWQRAMRVDG